MPRRNSKAKVDHNFIKMVLPLFIITVCIVFSFVFTVLMIPLGLVAADINMTWRTMVPQNEVIQTEEDKQKEAKGRR